MDRLRGSPDVLLRLHGVIQGERGLLAEALLTPSLSWRNDTVFAGLVASGERTRGEREEYALLVESILEGYLLHYARGRILDPPDDDQRLLAGDFLYAFGLTRLAWLGDLEAVHELADLISLCAEAHAPKEDSGTRLVPWELTSALWALMALAVAGGRWPSAQEAKQLARAGAPEAAEAARTAAHDRAAAMGAAVPLERALIAFAEHTAAEPSTK
jgi:hypothetical protein